MRVEKDNPVPLYYQLAEQIRERIRSGELERGEKLPSELELSKQSGVSRMTARQALSYLAREGLLTISRAWEPSSPSLSSPMMPSTCSGSPRR